MRATCLVTCLLLAGCFSPSGHDAARPPTGEPRSGPVRLETVVDGLDRPVAFVDAGGGRSLAVEQGGLVKVVRDGRVVGTFLDVSGEITSGGERGLLGLALSPSFADDGEVYVSTTDRDGDTLLARYRVGADGAVDPSTKATVLAVDQPFANHNGGNVVFGPDGMLWFGLGDGGSGGDPGNRAQDKGDLLGKLLRLDVRGGDPYSIPPDNPFAAGGGRPEVWAYGLRNPWRFSFDRETGDLWIGDVGQGKVEEIDLAEAGTGKGANYGWRVWEGTGRFLPGEAPGAVFPVAEYTHEETGGCSVTGGFVYRGRAAPALGGRYLFADYCSGAVWTLVREGGAWKVTTLLETGLRVSSFAEDRAGEVYVVDHGGQVLRFVQGED